MNDQLREDQGQVDQLTTTPKTSPIIVTATNGHYLQKHNQWY